MKLHLPKGLRSAVLACMAVVGGFATTVGTGFVVGGAMTIAFAIPQAQADLTWKGGYGDKTSADWASAINWTDGTSVTPDVKSGPGMPNGVFVPIIVDGGTEGVNFGSADSRVGLEGWDMDFTLNNVKLYATVVKFQGGADIKVTNNSTLDITRVANQFNETNFTIGKGSSVTLNIGDSPSNGQMTINLEDSSAYMAFKSTVAGTGRTMSGPIKVRAKLDELGEGLKSWTLLKTEDVTLNSVTYDFFKYKLSEEAITAENAASHVGQYYVDETYTVTYVPFTAEMNCYYTAASDFEWRDGCVVDGGAVFNNNDHMTFGNDSPIRATLVGGVVAGYVTLEAESEVALNGTGNLTAEVIELGSGATLSLSAIGNSVTTVALAENSTVVLAPGKAATLAEILGSPTITGAAKSTVEVSGSGTVLSGVGGAFNDWGTIVVSDGAELNADGASWGVAGKTITVTGEASVLKRTTGDDLFGWDSAQNINVLSGGKIDLGATRITMDPTDIVNLDNGSIVGTSTDDRGAFDLHKSSITINAKNGSVVAASIGGKETSSAALFNVTEDAADGTAGLEISGKLMRNLSFRKTGAGTLLLTAANTYTGTATVEEGTLAIKGADAIGKNLTVLDGATLALDGAVTLAGTNSLAGILAITNTATLNGSLTLGETAQVDLSDWVGGDTYQLFNLGEGANITPTLVKVAGREGSWMLNIDGALVESGDLHWLGGDFTWNAETEFEGGKVIPTAYVTFDANSGDVKATVEGALATAILEVEEGTNLVLSGTGTLSTDETRVEGEMTVGTTGNGFGTVKIGTDGTVTIGAAGNSMTSVEMGANSSLVIATGGTTTLADSIGTTNITGGTLGVATGTTLEVADGSLNTQKMDIAGELVISGCSLGADINISGKVTLNQGDGIDYGANNTITIDGGVLALGANRQTFGANNKLVLHDGTVTGTGDQHGAVDFYQDGGKITSTGTSSIEAPVRLRGSDQTTTMDVQDGTLTVSTVCNTGGGSAGNLSKIGAGTLAISGSLDTTGAVQINEGVLKMLNGSSATSAITLAGGSLAAEGTATMASLAGSGDITVAADGTLTITNVVSSGPFTKKGAGTLAIGTLTGNFVSMNHEGTQTVGTYDLEENAVLSYGKTGNLLKIDALTTAVAVDIFDIDISTGVSLNLGIASSVSKDLISVVGLESYELVDDNGYWKLTSAATELETDWDFNWGAAGLVGAPTSLATVTVAADATEHFLNGAPSTLTGGNGNVIVYGGTKLNNGNGEAPYAGDVWIQANEGQYKAIVGGHWANTWGSGSIAHFNGDTHILVDGATVGTVIGGTVQDGRGPVFTGNSYISIFSGDVTAAIVGAGTNAHGGTTTFTGNTNIFVYVPLATNNTGILESTTAPGDAIIGGGIKADSQNRNSTNIVNGSTNVTIDLSEYTGTGDKFAKKVIGGHFNWSGNLTANINGDTNVTVIGKSGITFTDMIVGGSRVNQGSISTTGTSSVNISGGSTFSSVVAAGSYLSGALTSTVGNTVLDITGGTYNGNLTGGSYVDAQGAVSRQGNSTLTVSGGTFSGNIAGASYLAQRATSTSGTSTVSISSSAFTGWVTGGVFTNSSSSVVTIGNVNMSLTDSSFSKLVAGGTFVGGNSTTNTIGDVNIVLDGVTLSNGLYGGVYHYGDSNASTSTVGDVTITLTGDGTISGNIWAAGGIRGNNANITVASTTVKVADTVAFADGVTLNAGFDKAATDSCVVAVTGDRSLIFTGTADQDRSTLAFAGFNKIGVETAGKTATIGALTATEAITIDGKGTIKLGAAATLAGGATVEGALDMNGQTVTGDVTVKGTLTSGSGAVAGTLTIDDAATLTDAAAATNIAVGTYTNTKGLTATDNINVGTKLTSSAAINATKITGEGSVEITGGTVTLSDTTDAFENTGTTSIADATLAGTWTADGVTIGTGIGTGVTASGVITLVNSTINSAITSTGSGKVVLSGDVTVGVTGVDGDSYYTHNGITAADGNGFHSGSTDYTLVNGTSDGTGVTNWLIGGTTATNATYANGKLTVKTDAVAATYWVNTGIVSYDGTAATYGGTPQSLAATTGIMLNGGTLQLTLTTGSVADGYISASTKGGTLDVNGQSITQAVFGTLEGKVELTGTGSYDLGTGVTALAKNVALAENVAPGTGWSGTVKMSNVTLNNDADAYSPYAATNLEVTNATITGKLEMKGGTLTLGGTITANMTALADETTTTISWSDGTTGTEGTGFSRTSRAVQLVNGTGTVSVATGTTWNAMEGATATFNTDDGVLTVTDKSWTKVFNIKAGDTVVYTATDPDFTNEDDVAATGIRMNGSKLMNDCTLNLNSALAGTMTDGIEVIGTGNTISINGTKTALAKGSLSVQTGAGVALTGNGIYDLSADTTDPTLGTGVSLATGSTGWIGTVKVSDATVSGWDIDTLANGANSTVEISGVTGSLAADAVDAKVAMAGTLTINVATTTTFNSAVTGTGELVMSADSHLTFDGDTSGWNGAITHTGTGASSVTYTGTTTIANSISNTGTGKLALYIDGTNIGGTAGVTVTGAVDVTALTIDRATTIKGSLAVSDTLTNNAGLTLTQDLTLAGQLDGTGSLTGTNLVLQGAANKVGDLTLTGALTMGTADVASKLTAGELDIAGGVRLESFDVSANVIEAASVASALTFNISDSVLDSMLAATKDKTLTLLKLTTGIDAVTAKQFMLGAFTATGTAATEQESERYRYTLAWNDDYTELTLKAAIAGYIWTGEAMEPDDGDPNTPQGLDYNWTAEGNWASGVVPNETSAVFFTGANKTNAIVAENVVAKAGSITIDAWDASRQSQFGISGDGTLAVTGDVVVNAGTLGLLLDTTIGGDVIINVGNGYSAPSGLLVGDFSGATASVDVAGGLSNAGSVMVNEGSELSVGAALTNKGILEVAGTVNVGTSSAPANMLNSGEVVVLGGALTVTGDMASTGADLRPEIPAIGINVLGGSLKVGGTLTNSDTVQVSGADTAVAAGSMVNTKGTLDVQGGQVTIGTEDATGTLVNTDGTITIGTADTTGSLTVNGDVSNGGGSITVENGALVATGAVNNDGGTLTVKSGSATTGALSSKGGGSITIGTDDTTGSLVVKGDVDITGGSLTLAGKDTTADISGDLTVTENKSLKVGEGTGLKVGGDLNADNVTLDFGGDVTVGGDVEIRTLTNNGVFTANGSENTQVHIDTLTNNGTLSVGKETDSVLTGGHLKIDTLSGKGAVNVGTGGSLTIGSETEFTGQLNNLGTLHITTTTLASAQTDAEQTAGDIVGESLSITDAALGYSGGAYKLGDVVTDKLTVDGISPDATRLSMASLKASDADAGGKVTLVLSDVEDGTVTDGSYHLITGSEETPFMAGGIHEVLDLSRYGYNEEGVYDATMATVQSDYMQKLLQLNKYVTFSDVAPTASVALLSGGTSDLYMSISEQTEEMSVWHLDGAHDKTEAGLTVLKDGKLVSDNILDNVQKVVVTGDQTIDLSGERKAVTLNGLTADGSEGAVTLTVSGDGSAVDQATLNTAADGFDGTLNLTKVSASINGKVPTINADTDTIGKLNVTDSDVNLLYRDTTLGGTMKGGSINFGLGSKELGVGVLKGDLAVVGTAINVEQTDDSIVIAGVGSGKTVIADLDATNGSAAVTLNGIGFNKYFANARLEGGAIVADRNAEYATQQIDPTTSNGEAGAQLIDDMFVDLNPQASMPGSAYAALMDMVDAGDIITDETAAAIAGSSISALGMALSGDVERQLRAIRNRTTSMGVNECVVNEGMPYFNAWFNAEGNRGKLSADGTAPGYTLDSWGGTVGFDVDVNPNLSMGLAITAMYGDFTAEGPDALEGDMDTYYLSLFARYADCAWTHTFVATVGMMDGSVERTVPGMYGTDSSIDGTTFGLMYEVGYVIPLDEDGEACVQPIFNVMLRHASVGSMTEEGAPLGLEVGKQSMTTLTFGLGARLQAVVGESLYNRASIFEARVLAKADVGDRRSEADVGFPYGGPRATVQSAELGAIGLEVGAGLTIPLGDDDGSIFFDASLELRSGYTNVNGTVGYRINF